MLFNSYSFLVFFPVVIGFYYLIPAKFRWLLLLVSSYYFYMCWNVSYILLIIASTVVDYVSGICIYESKRLRIKRLFLSISLLVNLGLLISFKYYGFLTTSAENLLGAFNLSYHFPEFDVLLPVGISFYTFQTLSYTIDIYRGVSKPERHFGVFALYVAYFPQLVAGPIERSYHLLPQLREWVTLNYVQIRNGIALMIFGFFKKIVIADRLAEYVNLVYNNPVDFGGLPSIMATYFFAFQIYCDFSGYSDIAIGAAMVLGVQLMTNFRQPYFSNNVIEFWRRWHISLSTWFRDYLYVPLGGNRVGKWRWYYNLMAVFMISGLWHGADWNFVIWGMLHGTYIVVTIVLLRPTSGIIPGRKPTFQKMVQIMLTFHLVLFSWVFFRANELNDSFIILGNIFNNTFWNEEINLFRFPIDFYISWILICLLILIEYLQLYKRLNERLENLHASIKWALAILVIAVIIILGKFEGADFLYFQF